MSPTNLSFYIRKRTVLNQVLDLEEVQARGAVGTLASFSPFEGGEEDFTRRSFRHGGLDRNKEEKVAEEFAGWITKQEATEQMGHSLRALKRLIQPHQALGGRHADDRQARRDAVGILKSGHIY